MFLLVCKQLVAHLFDRWHCEIVVEGGSREQVWPIKSEHGLVHLDNISTDGIISLKQDSYLSHSMFVNLASDYGT